MLTPRVKSPRSRSDSAVVIVRWPSKASVFHPRRFPGAAYSAARVFAAAAVRLASIKRERRL